MLELLPHKNVVRFVVHYLFSLKQSRIYEAIHKSLFIPRAGGDRPSGILGVSRCVLCTNVAPAPVPQTKKQLSFHCVISRLNKEKW